MWKFVEVKHKGGKWNQLEMMTLYIHHRFLIKPWKWELCTSHGWRRMNGGGSQNKNRYVFPWGQGEIRGESDTQFNWLVNFGWKIFGWWCTLARKYDANL